MCVRPVPDPKTVKNRVHHDLTSSAQDRDHEIGQLLALGTRRAGIGPTGAGSWTTGAREYRAHDADRGMPDQAGRI